MLVFFKTFALFSNWWKTNMEKKIEYVKCSKDKTGHIMTNSRFIFKQKTFKKSFDVKKGFALQMRHIEFDSAKLLFQTRLN